MSSPGRAPLGVTPADQPEDGTQDMSLWMEPEDTQDSLLPYLRLFWEHRRFLFRVGVRALLASILVALLIPVRYQSITRLMPPEGQSGMAMSLLTAVTGKGNMGGLGGLGGLAGDLLGAKSSGQLFVGIINSQTVQDRLINEFQLQKEYRDSKIEDARIDLAGHTTVSEDRKSGIITVGVTDHDPKRAAAMAQAYVKELDRLVAQVSTSSARRERIFLEGRLEKVKTDLDSAAKNFSDFASKNTAIDIPAQGRAMVEAAAMLQGQLIAARAELSGLQQIYTGNNVRVRAAEARVGELQKKLNEVGGAGTQNDLKNDNALFPSIRKLPLLGVTYADLFRQAKIQETVYEILTQQYELAKVQEAKEIPTVKVLDPAIVPTKRAFPPRVLIAALGTILAIAAAMTWIVGKARWAAVGDSDPRKLFATEVFATVQARLPQFPRNGNSAESNGHRSWDLRDKPADRESKEGNSR